MTASLSPLSLYTTLLAQSIHLETDFQRGCNRGDAGVRRKGRERLRLGLESKCSGGGWEDSGKEKSDYVRRGCGEKKIFLDVVQGCGREMMEWWSVGALHAAFHDLPLTYSKKKKRQCVCRSQPNMLVGSKLWLHRRSER